MFIWTFFIARTFWFEPVKRCRVASVSATPNARRIAFQQVVPEYLRTFIELSQVKKLLALLLALEVCEVVTPSPNSVWKWRRGSESNRRIRLLQSPALPLGYPAIQWTAIFIMKSLWLLRKLISSLTAGQRQPWNPQMPRQLTSPEIYSQGPVPFAVSITPLV